MSDPRRTGKPFERLVQLLEIVATAGARVEYDAHIPDRVTGTLRQVDVAVWQPSHHGDFLYAISCKDHARRVGVSFVEQEALKGSDIGAARVALVSRSGFTRDAISKAKFLNVDCLIVNEVAQTEWPTWMAIRTIQFQTLRWEIPYVGLNTPAATSATADI